MLIAVPLQQANYGLPLVDSSGPRKKSRNEHDIIPTDLGRSLKGMNKQSGVLPNNNGA